MDGGPINVHINRISKNNAKYPRVRIVSGPFEECNKAVPMLDGMRPLIHEIERELLQKQHKEKTILLPRLIGFKPGTGPG